MSDDEAMKKASDVGLIIEPGTFDKLRDLAKNPELTDKIDKELEEKIDVNKKKQKDVMKRNKEDLLKKKLKDKKSLKI